MATQSAPMSFSVSDGRGGLEYNGSSANGLFANRANLVSPSFHRMVRDLLRFNREAPALVGLNGAGPSLGEFLDEGGYSRVFVDRLLVPQASAVWSADPASMWEFPASLLAEFFANHGMFGFTGRPALARRRGRLGALRGAPDPRTSPTASASARPCAASSGSSDGVEVTPAGGEPMSFDEVILATHSDQALAMLGRRRAAPSARCSRRSATSPTTWCCTPTARCCRGGGAHGRAGTITSRTSPWAGRP